MTDHRTEQGEVAVPDSPPIQFFTLSDQAPPRDKSSPGVYAEGHYGVWDHVENRWAMLPSAVLCWGMPHDAALDCLIQLRGGPRAPTQEDR